VERPLIQLDLDIGDEASQPAMSPDGLRVLFVYKNQLAVRRLDEAKVRTLPGTADASYPFFSPDGRWVGFFAGGKLQKVATEGSAPMVVCDAPSGRGATWGKDNVIVAALRIRAGLSRVSASGGIPEPLTDLKGDGPVTSHRWPQVLPDGKSVLFGAYVASSDLSSLRVLTIKGGAPPKMLVDNAVYGRYMGNGYLIYFQRGTLFAVAMDPTRLQLTGSPTPLVDEVAFDRSFGAQFDASSSGTVVYRKGALENHIVEWLDSSSNREAILSKPASYWTPQLSPDGKRLALAIESEGKRNLWICDLTHGTTTRLTFDSELQLHPVWSPDGEFVAFQSGGVLAWVRSDGTGNVERLAVSNGTAIPVVILARRQMASVHSRRSAHRPGSLDRFGNENSRGVAVGTTSSVVAAAGPTRFRHHFARWTLGSV
jgi:hypothetical protein